MPRIRQKADVYRNEDFRRDVLSRLALLGIQQHDLAEHLGGKAIVFRPDPTKKEIQEILRQAEGAKKVIIGTYNGHLNPGQLELVRAFAEQCPQVAVFALRNPYDLKELPETVCGVAAYEYTRCCFDAIIELLRGSLIPTGKLPIRI